MAPSTPEVLLEQGRKARREGRPSYARNLLQKALMENRGTQNQSLRAELYIWLGQVERDLRDLATSESCYQSAVEILRLLDDRQRLAHTIRHLADILRERNQLELAGRLYSEALDIYRRDVESAALDLANALRGFALLKAELEERNEAISLWQEAKKLYARVGVEAGVEESAKRISALQLH